MPIRGDLAIDWSVSPRIIEVAAPSTELTVQDLYDTVRSKAALVEAMDKPEIIEGSGKEILSAAESVGLTIKLFNAKVKFEDRASPTDCNIYGGNLVAVDAEGTPMSPIKYATNVTATYAKSSSATLIPAIAGSGISAQDKEDIISGTVADLEAGRLSEMDARIEDIHDSVPNSRIASDDDILELEDRHGTKSWEGTPPETIAGMVTPARKKARF